jgi:hypothetical protein
MADVDAIQSHAAQTSQEDPLRSSKTALLIPALGLIMMCYGIRLHAVTTTFYIDPDFAGTARSGTAQRPWHSLADTGAWRTISARLAAGPVTVYFSARKASADTNQTSLIGLSIDRIDPSTNRLTLDGMSQYNTNPSAPAWSPYAGSSRFQITSNTVVDSDNTSSPYPDRNYVTIRGFKLVSTTGHIFMGGMNYLTFELNDYSSALGAVGGPGVSTGVPSVRNTGAHGGTWSSHIIIRNNTIHDTFGECIYIGGATPDPPGYGGALTAPAQTGTDILIQGNTLTNCGLRGGQGDGIDVKDGNTNLRIVNNVIQRTVAYHDCDCFCIGAESADLIEGNFCRIDAGLAWLGAPPWAGITPATAWHNSSGRHDLSIRNNIVVGMVSDAIRLNGANNLQNAWQKVSIYNNSVFRPGGDCIHVVPAGGTLPPAINIVNNICSSPRGNGVDMPTAAGSFTHNFNVFFGIAGFALRIAGRATICQSIAQSETSSICGNPQFVNTASPYTATGFKLAPSSPLIGKALPLASFDTDFFGVHRGSRWDIGAAAADVHNPPPSLDRDIVR